MDFQKEKEIFDAWFKSLNENGRTTYFLGQESTVAWEAWQVAKSAPNWISVENQMPEQGHKVLVFRPHAHEKPHQDPNYKICTYAGEGIFINSHFEHEITHWMPLICPPAPNNPVVLEVKEIEKNFDMNKFSIGQAVVYIDDFMPATVEIITGKSSDRIIFNHGSRSCIPEMIRPATETEIENKKRFMEQTL